MSLLARPMTYDDLSQMPDDGNRYELIGGELLVSPSPASPHQTVVVNVTLLIVPYIRERQLGRVLVAPQDVRFSQNDTVQPDVLFIRADRIDIIRPIGPVEGAPDLVVEILSPSNATVDRTRKAALYADFGVPEFWLVDPMERTVEVHVLGNDRRYVAIEPDVDGQLVSTIIPHLIIDPNAIFFDLM